MFIRGIRRKNKKVKTVFASIPSRKYTFSKNKNVNSLKPQVQRLMKTVDFSKIKTLAMQKPFDSNSEKKIFSAFRSENTPTASHQKI